MSPYPNRESADVVREVLPLRGARVLDVGCGDGSLVRLMTKEGADVIGLEISDRQLARARDETPVGDESYRVGRAETLPFEDDAFDIVAFYNSLHHIPVDSQDQALAESARVLASGGYLFVVEPLAEGPMFELMRPVDDETEVRAAALAALRRAAESPAFEEIREYSFSGDYRYQSFEAFKQAVLAVDSSRRARFEAHEPQLREAFERSARRNEDGYGFAHANRLNLLKRL